MVPCPCVSQTSGARHSGGTTGRGGGHDSDGGIGAGISETSGKGKVEQGLGQRRPQSSPRRRWGASANPARDLQLPTYSCRQISLWMIPSIPMKVYVIIITNSLNAQMLLLGLKFVVIISISSGWGAKQD